MPDIQTEKQRNEGLEDERHVLLFSTTLDFFWHCQFTTLAKDSRHAWNVFVANIGLDHNIGSKEDACFFVLFVSLSTIFKKVGQSNIGVTSILPDKNRQTCCSGLSC